jgi:hypothetical protein
MNDTTYTPHETRYAGYLMRSRLEAHWAAFFDLLEWPWSYEPVELAGYIPDFILRFYQPLLVEVKPAWTLDEMRAYTAKIDRSGWQGEALLVGLGPIEDDIAGLLYEPQMGWDTGVFFHCRNCHQYSLYHLAGTWSCRRHGCYDGNHYLGHVGDTIGAL